MAENTDDLEQAVYRLAAMVDTNIRFNAGLMTDSLTDKDKTYLDSWLKRERDPLLVTIVATLTGARNIEAPAEGEDVAVEESEAA